jgi:hypothetical protein
MRTSPTHEPRPKRPFCPGPLADAGLVFADRPGGDRLSPMGADGLVGAACGIVESDLTIAEWQHYVGSNVPYHRTCSG